MKLKEYRKLRGLSRAKFGVLVQASGLTVWRWETGRSMPEPSKITLIKEVTKGAVTADDHHQAVAAREAS